MVGENAEKTEETTRGAASGAPTHSHIPVGALLAAPRMLSFFLLPRDSDQPALEGKAGAAALNEVQRIA